MSALLKAIRTGCKDGYDQPGEFSTGMTYPSSTLQLAYDLASHVGQFVGRVGGRDE